jgi:hypothetical protein
VSSRFEECYCNARAHHKRQGLWVPTFALVHAHIFQGIDLGCKTSLATFSALILRSRALARRLEGRPRALVAILRDAAKRPLLRMRVVLGRASASLW